jgi:hypothetical protein
MLYKTMVLELLQQRTEMYDQLRSSRTLLPTLERYASDLRTSHEAWTDRLSEANPGSDERQITSEALELALKGLEDSLLPASPAAGGDSLSLDEAMAFLRRHTPPA